MPNTLIEYSSNLAVPPSQFDALTRAIHNEVSELIDADITRFRARVVQVDGYLANDGSDDDAVVFITMALLPGRPLELRKSIVQTIGGLATKHLEPTGSGQRARVSVELREIDPDVYQPIVLESE